MQEDLQLNLPKDRISDRRLLLSSLDDGKRILELRQRQGMDQLRSQAFEALLQECRKPLIGDMKILRDRSIRYGSTDSPSRSARNGTIILTTSTTRPISGSYCCWLDGCVNADADL